MNASQKVHLQMLIREFASVTCIVVSVSREGEKKALLKSQRRGWNKRDSCMLTLWIYMLTCFAQSHCKWTKTRCWWQMLLSLWSQASLTAQHKTPLKIRGRHMCWGGQSVPRGEADTWWSNEREERRRITCVQIWSHHLRWGTAREKGKEGEIGEGRKEGKGERELQRQREYKQGKQRWPQTTLELWLALYIVMLSWAYMYLMFLPIYSPKFGV